MYRSFAQAAACGAFLGLSVLGACSTKKTDDQAIQQTSPPPVAAVDSVAAPAAVAAPTKLELKDSANLSPRFLKELRGLGGAGAYAVRGQWLIMGKEDSVQFPLDLPAGKPVTYTSQQGGRTLTLTLTRTSYTTLRFTADAVGGSGGPRHEEGTADLNPGFLLAAEVPEDSESQVSYGVNEYQGETRTRTYSILVGIGPDADKAELSIFDATGQPLPQWQNLPTLRRPTM